MQHTSFRQNTTATKLQSVNNDFLTANEFVASTFINTPIDPNHGLPMAYSFPDAVIEIINSKPLGSPSSVVEDATKCYLRREFAVDKGCDPGIIVRTLAKEFDETRKRMRLPTRPGHPYQSPAQNIRNTDNIVGQQSAAPLSKELRRDIPGGRKSRFQAQVHDQTSTSSRGKQQFSRPRHREILNRAGS
ncbi:hypothetical protein M422DRAFT_43106 [Sphaerobolus stellatus SS14]|nr:hypothetical protein M422DRAFT_43106 [Sphaerobolus stellatus SS14]